MFKSRKLALTIWLATTALLTITMMLWETRGTVWTPWDFSIMKSLARMISKIPLESPEAQFGHAWSLKDAFGTMVLMSLVLGFAATLKNTRMILLAGAALLCGMAAFAWLEFSRTSLFPVVCLGSSFAFMFSGLLLVRALAVAKEQAALRAIFGKRAPEHVIAQIVKAPEQFTLAGEEKNLTLLFAKVSGFTSLAEQAPRPVLKLVLNDYFTEMTDIVIAAGGFVDKFMRDTFVAEFGMLTANENHAAQAVIAGLKMQRRLLDLHKQWTRQGWPCLQCRIGIHTGPVLVGNMGAREIVDYTVLGEAGDFAFHVMHLNKIYDTTLLISENTHAHLSPQEFRTRLVDKIKPREQAEAFLLYEVYGDLATFRSTRPTAYYQAYQQAFEAYLQRDFALALENCRKALAHIPGEAAATALCRRLEPLVSRGAPENWDGAVSLSELRATNLPS